MRVLGRGGVEWWGAELMKLRKNPALVHYG